MAHPTGEKMGGYLEIARQVIDELRHDTSQENRPDDGDFGRRCSPGTVVDPADVESIDPPPCPRCGRLEMWQTAAGGWRCLRCEPPTTAIRLLDRAQGIRRRSGMPARPEVAAMLAELRRLTSQAVRPCDAAAVVDT